MNETQAYKYSAFISYRHNSQDKACAEWLLNKLELYKVPKPLLKAGYSQRLGRIFRDKDELPSSGSLNDQIENALRASRYLIVICSSDTPNSRWVSREIEIFKEMGRTDKIIPVLIEGEPADSYPAVLKTKKLISFDQGVKDTSKIDWEPIGADFRFFFDKVLKKEIEKTEFLRVVASILSCSYDDLKQRELERIRAKRRRNIAIGMLTAAFICLCVTLLYFFYLQAEKEKQAKIATTLKELNDRSKILGNVAKKEENPITSALIALDAWNYRDPVPEKNFKHYLNMPIKKRIEELKKDWINPRHPPPDHSLAVAIVKANLAEPRETFYREYQRRDDCIIRHSADFSKILIGYETGIYYTIDINSGKLLSFGQIKGTIDNMAISKNIAHIISDKYYQTIDVTTGNVINKISFESETLRHSVFSPNMDYVALSFLSGELKLINFRTNRLERVAKYDLSPSIAWVGSPLIIANEKVFLWYDIAKKEFGKSFNLGGKVKEIIARQTKGEKGFAFRVDEGQVKILTTENRKVQHFKIGIENLKSYEGDGIYIDFDSQRLYANTKKNKIVIYSLSTGKQLETQLSCDNEPFSALLLFDDNKKIAAGTVDGTICVWSTQDFKVLAKETLSEDGIYELTYDSFHNELFMALRSGEIIGWNPEKKKDRITIPFCKEDVAQLLFDPSGEYLFGAAAGMGIYRWDLKNSYKMSHMPAFKMSILFTPFVYQGKEMVLTDRMGNIIVGSIPELNNSRIISVDNEAFMAAGMADQGKYVIGQAASGYLYVWATNHFGKPVRLNKSFASTAVVHSLSNLSRFIPVVDSQGYAYIFDAHSGKHIASIQSSVDIALIFSSDMESIVGIITKDDKQFCIKYSKLSTINGKNIQVSELEPYRSKDIFMDYLPISVSGDIYLGDASGHNSVYCLKSPNPEKSMHGGTYRSIPPDQGLLAGISSSFKKEPEVIIDKIPRLISRHYSPQFIRENNAAKKLPYSDLLIWQDFWKIESQSWVFSNAIKQVNRCLTPEQRRRFNLSKEPPCWCSDKPYPTRDQWIESLGYDPFADKRRDGNICTTQ